MLQHAYLVCKITFATWYNSLMSSQIPKLLARPGKQFLEFSSGRKFFYLADTWWYGLTDRWNGEQFEQTVKFRKSQGFTAIQLVVGVPPEIPFWSEQAFAKGQHPFLQNYDPNPAYFDAIEKRIHSIIENKMIPVIFGNWGYHIDQVGVEKMKLFWKEIIQRFSNKPVIYCLTGEADLFPPPGYFQQGRIRKLIQRFSILKKLFPKQPNNLITQQRINDWSQVAKYIKSLDPVTPLTVHPHSQQSASKLFSNPDWLDIDAVQSGHSQQANDFYLKQVKNGNLKQPFLDLEAPYEGIFDQFHGETQVEQMMIRVDAGSAGYSYGAHGLWNLSRSDDTFMHHWGQNTWQHAVKAPGAELLSGRTK